MFILDIKKINKKQVKVKKYYIKTVKALNIRAFTVFKNLNLN